MLKKGNPLLKRNVADRVVNQGIVDRTPIKLVAVIMDDTPEKIITFRDGATWDCVK